MVGSNRAFSFAALIDVVPGACQDHVKVQTVNTDAGKRKLWSIDVYSCMEQIERDERMTSFASMKADNDTSIECIYFP